MRVSEEQTPACVAVVLVVHNGERWLPTFLEALPAALSPQVAAVAPDFSDIDAQVASASQTDLAARAGAPPTIEAGPIPVPRMDLDWVDDGHIASLPLPEPSVTLIAVDTGSVDDSARLVRDFGFTVLEAEASTPFGRAVAIARAHLVGNGQTPQWLWLLHDDTEPLAQCLPELLAAATSADAAVCGPMVVRWGSGDLISEIGIRLTGAGRRVTAVDPGEVDQGQYDDVQARHTLAVSSTAMLVRTDTWDTLAGFDPAFPMSGDDIDFCRRTHRVGGSVVVAARAKVRHAGAMSNRRRPHSRSLRPRRDARLAAIHMQIAHASSLTWPLVALRMVFGTFLAAGIAAARSDFVGARDEIDGLVRFLAHPSRVFVSRHRVADASVQSKSVERKFRVPLRERLRGATRALVSLTEVLTRITGDEGSSPIFLDEETEAARPMRSEVWRRLWHRPAVLGPAALAVLCAVLQAKLLVGHGPVVGDLLPASFQTSGDVWRSYLSSWHDIGRGSAAPVPPWTLALAVFALLFAGSINAALIFLLVFFIPLFVISFSLSFRSIVASPWARTIVGLCVAVSPVLIEARDRGDISILVVALLLPPLARLAVSAVATPSAERWARLALLVALVVAFEPMVWLLALAAAVLMAIFATPVRRHGWRMCATLVAPWLVLLPMSAQWLHQPSLLVMSTGALAEQNPSSTAIWWHTLSLSSLGWRWWGVVVTVLGVAAMVRGASHRFTRDLGLAVLVPIAALVVANHVTFRVAGLVQPTAPDPSVPMLLLAVACGVSLATAADGLLPALRRRGLGARHVFAGASAAAILASASCGLWLTITGSGSTIARGMRADIPAFAAADLEISERPRVLVLHADDPSPLAFAVRSARTSLLGEDDILRMQGGDALLTDAVRTLVAQGEVSAGERTSALAIVADAGIRYLALSPQGSGASAVAQALVRAPGLRQLAAAQDGRGWWLWRVPGQPARAMFAPLTSPSTTGASGTSRAQPWSDFVTTSRSDSGAVRLFKQANSTPSTCCVVSPGTVRIADATQGWTANVDGRTATVERTASGTVVIDLPLGVRDAIEITRVDRSRALWLVVQFSIIGVLAFAAITSRRRDDAQEALA